MKKLLTFFAILTILVIGIIVALSLNLDRAIKKGAETFGPKLTGGAVTIDKVSLSILSGSGKISGVTIGNPPGFTTDAAIRLKTVRIAIVPKSLLGDRIRVKNVLVENPEITYEASLKGSNINRIMTNIQNATGKNNDAAAASKKPGKQVLIDDLLITGGTVRMSATILKGKTVDLPLPEIHLTNIGQEKKGASIDEATRQVFGAVQRGVGKAVAESGEFVGKAAESLKNTGKEAAAATSEGVKSVFKGIGDALSGGQ